MVVEEPEGVGTDIAGDAGEEVHNTQNVVVSAGTRDMVGLEKMVPWEKVVAMEGKEKER